MQRNPQESQEFANNRGTYFLGRYRVVDEIGIGGMASVHLARMDGPGGFQKWAAIKRIHPHLIEDDSFVQMFFDEARVAARISHPNVATVFELGKHEDTYWIAMEYLHGEPLRELMRRTEELARPMPPEIACKLISDAAEGLHAAHELSGNNGEKLGLVHRDVTPHNLFVTYDGVTKVVDFGIAKFSSRMSSSTRAGTLKGKLAYMAPEQIAGESIDRRSDIFALGVVLWELTTGQRLFRMDNDLDTLAKVQECNVPRPSSIIRGYPVDLEKIILKALVKNRGERYRTAREFSRALQSFFLRRGLFIASDEIAAYMHSIFHDRMQKREAHLRWAAEVTQTVSVSTLGNIAPTPDDQQSGPRPAAGEPARLSAREASANPNSPMPIARQSVAPTTAAGMRSPLVGTSNRPPKPASVPPSNPPRPLAAGLGGAMGAGLGPERPRIPTQFGLAPPVDGPRADRPSVAPSPPRASVPPPSRAANSEPPTMIAQARKASLPPAIPALHHLDGAIPPPEDDGEENDATMVEPAPFDSPEPSAPTQALSGSAHGEMPQIAFPPSPQLAPRPPATAAEGAFNPFEGGTFMPLGDSGGAAPLVTNQSGGGGGWAPFVTQPGLGSGEAPANPFGATVPRLAPAPADMRTVTARAVGDRDRNRNLLVAGTIGAFILFVSIVALFFAFRGGDNKPRQDGPEVKATPSAGSTTLPLPTDIAGATTGPFVTARKAFSGVLAVAAPPPSLATPPPTGGTPAPTPPTPDPTVEPPAPTPPPTADPPATAAPKAPEPPKPEPPKPEPKRPQTPAATPPAPAAGGTGQLSIVCLPACSDISDNGASLGGGPVFGITVPAGRHSIKLVSKSSPPVIKSMSIIVKADQKTELRQSMVQ